jgi:hypothetical protein
MRKAFARRRRPEPAGSIRYSANGKPPVVIHSYLSATIESTFVARRAGM